MLQLIGTQCSICWTLRSSTRLESMVLLTKTSLGWAAVWHPQGALNAAAPWHVTAMLKPHGIDSEGRNTVFLSVNAQSRHGHPSHGLHRWDFHHQHAQQAGTQSPNLCCNWPCQKDTQLLLLSYWLIWVVSHHYGYVFLLLTMNLLTFYSSSSLTQAWILWKCRLVSRMDCNGKTAHNRNLQQLLHITSCTRCSKCWHGQGMHVRQSKSSVCDPLDAKSHPIAAIIRQQCIRWSPIPFQAQAQDIE